MKRITLCLAVSSALMAGGLAEEMEAPAMNMANMTDMGNMTMNGTDMNGTMMNDTMMNDTMSAEETEGGDGRRKLLADMMADMMDNATDAMANMTDMGNMTMNGTDMNGTMMNDTMMNDTMPAEETE